MSTVTLCINTFHRLRVSRRDFDDVLKENLCVRVCVKAIYKQFRHRATVDKTRDGWLRCLCTLVHPVDPILSHKIKEQVPSKSVSRNLKVKPHSDFICYQSFTNLHHLSIEW